MINKIINKIIKIKFLEKIYTKNEEKFFLFFQKYIECTYSSSYIFSITWPMGETTYASLLMREFKKKYNSQVVLIVSSVNSAEYVKHYSDIDIVIPTSLSFVKYLSSKLQIQSEIKKGKIFDIANGLSRETISSRLYSNMLEHFKNNIGICGNYELSKLNIDVEICQKLKEKYTLNERTILLVPIAMTLNYRCLSVCFWKKLILMLKKKGYRVFINSKEKLYGEEFNYIYESIYNTVLFASLAKCVIGFRSGFFDITVPNITTKQIVLYPSSDFNMYLNFSNIELMKKFNVNSTKELEISINNFSSFVKMYNSNNVLEYVVKKNKEDILLKKIVSFLN